MFYGCHSITSIVLSNFNTSKVLNMYSMFNNCFSLLTLNLSSFDTSQVLYMSWMFFNCSSLTYLDLSNFDTSKVEYMYSMFNGCNSLHSLILCNFNISQVKEMIYMFNGCSSLEYLNFENAKMNISCNYSNIFNGTSDNLIICSKYNSWKEILNGCKLINISCINIYDGKKNNNSLKCYNKCSDEKNISDVCQKCGHNYYQINNSSINNILFNNSYKQIESYYFDNKTLIYKPCFNTCKACDKEGNETFHNCIECKNGYQIDPNGSYYYNCFLNIREAETFKEISDIIFTNEIILNNKNKLVINTIKEIINNFNISNIDENNDISVKEENILITMTNTKNQKENENKNVTTINFGECEKNLKKVYNIPENNSLYIIKIDVKEEGMNIPKIEYEVYYPLYNDKLIKLNLTECKDMNIEISIPVKINDNLEKYDSKSNYYNDFCSRAISENGTDISLSDRKKQFINDNMTLCEEDCRLIEYDYETEKAKCSCLVKIRLPLIDDIKFDKNELYKSFTDIKNIVNFKLLKCFKNVLIKTVLKRIMAFSFIHLYSFYLLFV